MIEIDENELVDLALSLGNIYSATGYEEEASDFVASWLAREGFEVEQVAAVPGRPNVLGRLPGTGGGRSLAFNSHLDTSFSRDHAIMYANPADPAYSSAWYEADRRRVWGIGVVNCKGPMACWMLAAKSLLKSGTVLQGDLVLTAVVGEIDQEPVDEFQGPRYLAEDIGTRFVASHGGLADFAVVAEATGLRVGWVEAGKVFFKVDVRQAPSKYTPYVEHSRDLRSSPSAIGRAAAFIEAFESWAIEYPERYRSETSGGTVVPQASIGAIRGGVPFMIARHPEVCRLYVDVRLTPDTPPLAIQDELTALAASSGVEARITPFLYRRGYVAEGVASLLKALEHAHTEVVESNLERARDAEVSMWRDTNPYNELGIPALTYGPGAGSGGGGQYLDLDEMVAAAKVYASAAAIVCGQPRTKGR